MLFEKDFLNKEAIAKRKQENIEKIDARLALLRAGKEAGAPAPSRAVVRS